MLHLHAVNAKEEITRQQKINGQRLTNWSLVNTVNSAESILYIKRPNKEFFERRRAKTGGFNKRFCRPVALTAERRTPNPGVGGSNPSWPANSF